MEKTNEIQKTQDVNFKEVNLKIPERTISTIIVEIQGSSPLIVHQFGAKAVKAMEEYQAGTSKKDRTRYPEQESEDCFHKFPEPFSKLYGFPAMGFKLAMVRAGKMLKYKMTDLRQVLFVQPDPRSGELVEIKGEPTLRTDRVNVGNGQLDIRYRPEFKKWSTILNIEFNDNVLKADSVLQLLMAAGQNVGVGDWRPERNGTFGTWLISKARILQRVKKEE